MWILQFYKHLQQSQCDTTLHEAYETSMQITHQMKKCWHKSCQNIINYIEANTSIGADALFDKKAVTTSLMYNYVKHWEHKVALEPKVWTYISSRHKFLYEDYLNLSNIEHRKAMTRIRIISHRLAIERRRYTTPVTPVEEVNVKCAIKKGLKMKLITCYLVNIARV